MYPALSVVQTLMSKRQSAAGGASASPAAGLQLLWVGSHTGLEADLVPRAGLPFKSIAGGGVHGVGWRMPLNAMHLAWGTLEAVRLVRGFRPDVLLVTGGFITAAVAAAAWLSRVPILVYLPDIEPALAVRFISRLARRIAVTAEESRAFFAALGQAHKVVVTGYPTRPELSAATRAQGAAHFGLAAGRPTLLVTGGSRGARSLNRAVFAALPGWLRDYQVIHLTGQLDWGEAERARAALPEALRPHYHAHPYLHEMGLALAAADLVVSRAGASALGEYPLFGLPAVLVPYPYAWRYQKVNAGVLVRRGAAVQLKDEELAARLDGEVRALLGDPARLAAMRQAARAAAAPRAAEHIGEELVRLGGLARP